MEGDVFWVVPVRGYGYELLIAGCWRLWWCERAAGDVMAGSPGLTYEFFLRPIHIAMTMDP